MLIALLLPQSATAATLEVGADKAYSTISAAISAAASGDTVKVYAGTYSEAPDPRGKNLTVTSVRGPAWTTIAATGTIYVNDGTFEGFRISPAPSTGVYVVSGSPVVRDLWIETPSTYGVYIAAGSPSVTEVVVKDAGLHAFLSKSDTATIQHDISWNAVTSGFAMSAGGIVANSIAFGGSIGFKAEGASTTINHVLDIGSDYGVSALYAATVANSIFYDAGTMVKCSDSVTASFTNGLAYPSASTSNCPSGTGTLVAISEPTFLAYNDTLDLLWMDLHNAADSAAVDAGSDTDPDGSTGDLGPFGGSAGEWRDQDADGWPDPFDCDDKNAATHAYAGEIADGEDNDCDGSIDEDVPIDTGPIDTGPVDTGETGDSGDSGDSVPVDTGPVDLDGDGYISDLDCDDHNQRSYPGATEVPDYADNDCDGSIDEGTAFGDSDMDGYTLGNGDCDDTDNDIHPGVTEPMVADGIDQDCDGVDDWGRSTIDSDGDGYTEDADCDDADAARNPNAHEASNLVDDDCDGRADEDWIDADHDSDGYTPAEGDCDDYDATYHPGAADLADDFLDEDCTGTDNYDIDRDGDAAPISGGTDCDDTRSTVHPGAEEICGDGLDEDCDGEIDEGCATDTDTGAAQKDSGCAGCASTPSGEGLAGLVLVGLLVGRRRR